MSSGKEDVLGRGTLLSQEKRVDSCFSQRRGTSLSPWEPSGSLAGPLWGRVTTSGVWSQPSGRAPAGQCGDTCELVRCLPQEHTTLRP